MKEGKEKEISKATVALVRETGVEVGFSSTFDDALKFLCSI